MASVTLDKLWLHDAADPATYLALPARVPDEVDSAVGEVRTYAGGRQRVVTRAARPRKLNYELIRVSSSDLETLRGWKGTILLLRDYHGRRLWGVYFELGIKNWRGEAAHDVSFDVREVSWTEAV